MTDQDQKAGSGATALQAGRDIIIQHGMTPEQMTQIMVSMARTLSTYQAEAREEADARLASFREELLRTFAEPGKANPEAFRDPDFQYLLNDSQESFARSGDEAVRDTLVDIIARRSLEKTRTRLALTLNDAATKATNLTANEFAALSLIYVARYTIRHNIGTFEQFCEYVKNNLIPFVKDISREQSSFGHMQTQSCGSISLGQADLFDLFRTSYGGVLGVGFDRAQLESHLPDGKKNAMDMLLIPSLHDASKLQPAAITFDVLKSKASETGLTENELQNVWNLFVSTIPPLNELLPPIISDFESLTDVWNNTLLKNFDLTPVGIAIGHANAKRVIGFDAPLDVWIK
ncbi:hypothetical protein KMZ29_17830 [Bradyrhizobium sediminis]|uniref:Uncharacterized protein n=1 Tax=Bradyrhizobium sediminis TaxID=2840469 RepID=A0A975RLL9_9BRAD|nr:LPO_1073/Vpar_1526 family protein [Bradyrhizobium sediminis]QWG11581.1 hypothetical protein KMZ29_17830 [Bradyrhizobium sediminis]